MSCHIDLRDIADSERCISHGCHTSLLVELAQTQLVHPNLTACVLVYAIIAHTDHDGGYLLEGRITHDGDFILRLVVAFVIDDVGLGVAGILVSGSFGFVAGCLGAGEDRQREIEHVRLRPYAFTVVLRLVVIHAGSRQFERYLVFVIVIAHIATHSDETGQVVILQFQI